MANLDQTDAVANGNGELVIINGTADADTIDISGDTQGLSFEISALGGDNTIIATTDAGHKITSDGGNDNVTTGDGKDDIRTGAGNDTVVAGNGEEQIIITGDGNDDITGGDDFDLIDAGDGDDTINAGLGRDDITPGAGIDTIDGGDGGETFSGDVLQYQHSLDDIQSIAYDGTTLVVTSDNGVDTATNMEVMRFQVEAQSVFLSESLVLGLATADDFSASGTAGGETFLTGDGDDIVNAGDGVDKIFTGSGDDQITEAGGNDLIYAGAGTDTVTMGVAKADVTEVTLDTANNKVILTTSQGVDTYHNVEEFVFTDGGGETVLFGDIATEFAGTPGLPVEGTAGADNPLDGTAAGEEINGLGGDDVINANGGSDTIDGGDDDDTVNFSFAVADVSSYTNDGTTITLVRPIDAFSNNTTTVTNVENFDFNGTAVTLAEMDDTFAAVNTEDLTPTGNGTNQDLTGGLGDDTITLSAGDETVDGNDGDDTAVMGIAVADVTAYSNDGTTISVTSVAGGTDTFTEVESFDFNGTVIAAADLNANASLNAVRTDAQTINGDTDPNALTGGAGDDTITPGAGDDVVDGGAGDDTVVFGINVADVTAYTNDGTTITIVSDDEGTDQITNVEMFEFADTTITSVGDLDTALAAVAVEDQTIPGTAGADALVGALGDDTFTPMAGDDSVDGADGDDTVVFGIATTDVTAYTNDGTTVTITSSEGVDTITNVENFKFSDTATAITLANLDSTFSTVDDDTFTSTSGNDAFDGGNGTDKVVFGYATTGLTSLTSDGTTLTVVGEEGTDTLTSIETLQFSNGIFAVDGLTLGTSAGETLAGSANADVIDAGAGMDTINAGAGNDLVLNVAAGENVDGGAGSDTVKFTFAESDITSATENENGSVSIVTADGTTTLSSVESVILAGGEQSSLGFVATQQNGGPVFTSQDAGSGSSSLTPTAYEGPVDYLEFTLIADGANNNVVGDSTNDFINLGAGDDAAEGGAGDDILDGGLGSNFLTGGAGADQFYIDGRGAAPDAPTTWSTIVDFSAEDGDTVNVWGWIDGTSALLSTKVAGEAGSGATGFEGFTHHYDLDGNGDIDTSITFTGLAAAPATNEAREISGLGYQFYGA